VVAQEQKIKLAKPFQSTEPATRLSNTPAPTARDPAKSDPSRDPYDAEKPSGSTPTSTQTRRFHPTPSFLIPSISRGNCFSANHRDIRALNFRVRIFRSRVYCFCMTTDERLDRLTGIVETLAGAVTAHDSVLEAHDRQIGALIELADRNQKAMNDLDRRWQAYLNTLRKQ